VPVSAREGNAYNQAPQAASAALNAAHPRTVVGMPDGVAPTDGLLGAWVTRAGPLLGRVLSRPDQESLQRLDFRPVFVGVEPTLVQAAITGDVAGIRGLMPSQRVTTGSLRTDGASVWMVRPVDGLAIE
jgi:hypothetical protein